MKYMITDNHGKYLRRDASGNYIPCKNKAMCEVWEQKNKAVNILKNCVNKNLRSRYSILEIDSSSGQKKKRKQGSGGYGQYKKAENLTSNKSANDNLIEDDIESLADDIDKLVDFAQNSEQKKTQLYEALSTIDKEISDINHYIEFGGNFNAYQGWIIFDMLRSSLRKRRKIKDEIYILTQLGECKVNSAMISKIKEEIENLGKREYQPRVLKQLFGTDK